MYKLLPDFFGKSANSVIRIEDGAIVPFDESNTDYQKYLKWLEEGNTPIPADEGTQQ